MVWEACCTNTFANCAAQAVSYNRRARSVPRVPIGNLVALLPLFPLDVVLLPGAPLPLHIFEPRYKEMMGECRANNAPFGVIRAVNEGIRKAQKLAATRMEAAAGPLAGGMGGLGIPGL